MKRILLIIGFFFALIITPATAQIYTLEKLSGVITDPMQLDTLRIGYGVQTITPTTFVDINPSVLSYPKNIESNMPIIKSDEE